MSLISLTTLLISGCVPGIVIPPQLPQLDNPRDYLADFTNRGRLLEQLAGVMKLSISGRAGTQTVKTIFFIQRPDRIRIDTLGLFNQPASMLSIDSHAIWLYVPSHNTLYTGDASPENIAALTGLRLTPHQIIGTLMGDPPAGIDPPADSITYRREAQHYIYSVPNADGTVILQLTPGDSPVERYRITAAGHPDREICYAEFKLHSGRRLPGRITFSAPGEAMTALARIMTLQEESFDTSVFSLPVPPGAAVRPLETAQPILPENR